MNKELAHNARLQLEQYLHPLHAQLNDPEVTEIAINTPRQVWVKKRNCFTRLEVSFADESIRSLIQVIARLNHRDADDRTTEAVVDARLDGLRVAAVLAPTAVGGHAMCIRKHSQHVLTLDQLEHFGGFDAVDEVDGSPNEYDQELAQQGGRFLKEFLRHLVVSRENILIAGSTDSGKTTLVNALLAHVPEWERVLTIEDTSELKVHAPNRVMFETNAQNGITAEMMVKLTLRFCGDRALIGEVRGAEAYDLMRAANSGSRGCIATLHANSALAATTALESLIRRAVEMPLQALRADIAQAFPYIVFQEKRVGGKRCISQVIKLTGVDDSTHRYTFVPLFTRSYRYGTTPPVPLTLAAVG